MDQARRVRANGVESRQKILDAATEIAGERGYDGTSIALVSERSGLPASSIYWHFKDKDALLAAVVERSYGRWLAGVGGWAAPGPDATRHEVLRAMLVQTAKSLLDAPDFLRLGLMLTLERRPEQVSARSVFLAVRAEAHRRTTDAFQQLFAELDADDVRQLATLSMAIADGLFIANEIDGDSIDLFAAFDSAVVALLAAAQRFANRVDGRLIDE
jgi:AcrR family transcriptional regulator